MKLRDTWGVYNEYILLNEDIQWKINSDSQMEDVDVGA